MLSSFPTSRPMEQDYQIFRTKGFSPDWVICGVPHENLSTDERAPTARLSMASLPPFLRTLLVTDGTVTKSLEAYYWEPVVVDTVSQRMMAAEGDVGALDVRAGDEVLGRYVHLRGAHSNVTYTRASSVIRLASVPEELREKLLAGSIGIGELIRDCGLETYRELLEIGFTSGDRNGRPAAPEDIFRTYRIILNHTPTILVTEHFPISIFDDRHGVPPLGM